MNEAAAEEGDGLVRDGTLTAEWLEANAGRLSTADQRYYQRILSGEEAVSTDLEVYTDLRERAGRGEDVKSEARLALTERRIKQSDYDKILNAFESTTVRPWYKRGETYLTNFLKPSEINYNIDQAQAYALAMDDWQRWAESNPDATIEQAEAAYRRIGQNYQTIEIENTFSGAKSRSTWSAAASNRPWRILRKPPNARHKPLNSGKLTKKNSNAKLR